ncbi:uncharacterized protein LOC113279846 [Papaver somniferum]|uniref:uncharacterized protein LOC113279846 n=1 Tax=Papaver somniferum TaxID=3469 RepID=UPI000E704300|nr:uncharacterized protein LOC113279846 [Papaver somniferum]
MKYQVESGYKVKPVKSDQKRYTVCCLFKEEKGCKWRFHSSLAFKNSRAFKCKNFILEHSCGLACSDPSKFRMTNTFIKNIIKDDIRVSTKQKSAAIIQDLFSREYQVDLSYHQAYRGLKYCFNKYCRPMLTIDATFLIGKFRGGLMVACGKTGNQEIFPVAFGIVSGENSYNWRWFLENLKGNVDVDRPLTIIFDRGTGLLNIVPEIFPNAFHSYCSYHMKGNIPVVKGKSRQTAIKLFEQCSSVVTKEQFLKAVSSMVNLKLFSVIEWMNKIPLKNWAAHEFEGERFGELTSNVVESFNNLIRHEKRLKSIELIECIRARKMETMWKRKLAARNWTTRLTPKMQTRLDKRITDCCRYKVRRASEKVFEIITNTGKNTVDLDSHTCTCQWCKKHSFPCSPSVKAMVHIGEEEVYKHITPYYTAK